MILPGGCESSCLSHVFRTVFRCIFFDIFNIIDEGNEVDERVLAYMNRLSDYFFMLSRRLNQIEGDNDIIL